MTPKRFTVAAAIILVVLLVPSVASSAHAQYLGNPSEDGIQGAGTLEEILQLASERIRIVNENPEAGSGTPYLALDGVLGASVITAGVFGGIAAAFIVKGRHGQYALPGAG